MGKKMKLPFPFIKSTQLDQQWQWPSCVNSPNTLSFRANAGDMFKTINSAYEEMGTSTSATTEPSSPQLGYPVDHSEDDSIIHGVMQSERLFFTPGDTNSILEEEKTKRKQNGFVGIKEIKNVVMEEMESTNPYVDFRKSMEEMVEANEGIKGSMEGLQELLSCYLKINERNNHGYIVGAFVDLLTSFSFDQEEEEDDDDDEHNQNQNNNDLSSSSNSPISAMSFTSNSSSTCTSSTARSTTPCLSFSEGGGGSSSEKTLVVVENNSSPRCSSKV